jgi:hypothetical protein
MASPRLPGLPTIAALMLSAMLAVWLGLFGPLDLNRVQDAPRIWISATLVCIGALAAWILLHIRKITWKQVGPFFKREGVGLLSFAAAAAAAAYTYRQADIANEALLIGQRAFVQFDGVDASIAENWESHSERDAKMTFYDPPKDLGKMVHFKFRLTNSGNTPTKTMRIGLRCFAYPALMIEKRDDPFDFFHWEEQRPVIRSLGAHQTIEVSNGSCDITHQETLKLAQMQMIPFLLFGYIKYEDWVEPGKVHRTQFALKLIVQNVGDARTFDGVSVETEPVGRHNCTDQDCDGD